MTTQKAGRRLIAPLMPLLVLWICASYATLRLEMNREFIPWKDLLELTAPLPFGHRVLVPILALPLYRVTGWSPKTVFTMFEFLSALGLWAACIYVLGQWMPTTRARAFATLFLLLLPFSFLLQHRWPIFYPFDTPAMAFTALGLGLISRSRWRLALAIAALAAFNRESAVLLPFCAVFLHSHRELRRVAAWALAMSVAILASRKAISLALPNNAGDAIWLHVDGRLRLVNNLDWLATPNHWLLLPSYFAFLPLAWPCLWSDIPSPLRRLTWVMGGYFLCLLVTANIYEPRVFGEILILLFVPLAVSISLKLDFLTQSSAAT